MERVPEKISELPPHERLAVWHRAKKYYQSILDKKVTRYALNKKVRRLKNQIEEYVEGDREDIHQVAKEAISIKVALNMFRFGSDAIDERMRREIMKGVRFSSKHPKIYGNEAYFYYPNLNVSEMVYTSPRRFFYGGINRVEEIYDELDIMFSSISKAVNILGGIIVWESGNSTAKRFWRRNTNDTPIVRGIQRAPEVLKSLIQSRSDMVNSISRDKLNVFYKLKILFYMDSEVLGPTSTKYAHHVRDRDGKVKRFDMVPTFAETPFVRKRDKLKSDITQELVRWQRRYSVRQLGAVWDYQMAFFILYVPKRSRDREARGRMRQVAIHLASKKYFIRDVKCRRNCLYSAITQCLNCCDMDYFYPEVNKKPHNYVLLRAIDLKKRLKAKGIGGEEVNDAWVKGVAKHFAKRVEIYDFDFKKIFRANGEKLLGHRSNKKKFSHVKTCRIWVHHNHGYAMLSKKIIRHYNRDLYDKMMKEHKDLMKGKLDYKLFNLPKGLIVPPKVEGVPVPPFGMEVIDGELKTKEFFEDRWGHVEPSINNLVAYDLETLLDKNSNESDIMKCYAVGLAFVRPRDDIFQAMQCYASNISGMTIKDGECYDKKPRIFRLKMGNCLRHVYMTTVTFFHKTRAIDLCFDYVETFKRFFNNSIWFAHNGGKFDFPVMLREYFFKKDKNFFISKRGCLSVCNRYINVCVLHKEGKFKMIIKDSYAFMQGSLARLAKEVNVRFKKMEDTIDHNEITMENCLTYPNIDNYLEYDCLALFELISIYIQRIKEMTQNKVNVLTSYTAASLSKNIFLKCFYDRNTPVKDLIYSYPDDIDEFVRSAYFGGRVECDYIGNFDVNGGPFKSIQYLDFTSHYPACGRDFDLPVGNPKWVTFDNVEKCPKEFFGFLEIWVKSIDFSKKPIFAIHDNKSGLMICPHFKAWRKIKVFSEEMKYAETYNMYSMKCIRGVEMKRGSPLKRFFNDVFQMKAEYKKQKKLAMAFAAKVTINSGYGFWAMRTKNRQCLIIMRRECNDWRNILMVMMNEGKVIDFSIVGDYVVIKLLRDIESKCISVGLAAAITSYARMRLHELQEDVIKAGGFPMYCDTDSVVVGWKEDTCFEDHPDLVDKYMKKDGKLTHGEHLGGLTNEFGKRERVRKATFITCKFYSLTPMNEKIRPVVKTKGFVKKGVDNGTCMVTINAEDLERMLRDSDFSVFRKNDKLFKSITTRAPIKQEQIQFRQNVQMIIDRAPGVRVENMIKLAYIQYSKGEICRLDGFENIYKIKPLEI